MNTLLGVFVTVIVTAFVCNFLQRNETVTINKDLMFFVIAIVPASVSNFPLYQGLNIISCLAFKELLGFAFSSFSRYSHVLMNVWLLSVSSFVFGFADQNTFYSESSREH